MSTSTKTLVFLWLCLYQVSGLPVAKRTSASGVGDDVLAGSDFLSVFMQRSEAGKSARPIADFQDRSKPHYSRHDYDNSVIHRVPELSQYSENYEKYNKPYNTDVDYTESESNMSPEVDSYKASSEVISAAEVNVKPTPETETTTAVEENPTTLLDVEESLLIGHREDDSTLVESERNVSMKNEIQQTPTTTEAVKVISVRVSSSVVRHSGKPTANHNSENKEARESDSNRNTSEQHYSKLPEEAFTGQETTQEETFANDSKENQEKLEAEESKQSKKTSDTHPYILTEENLVSTLVTQDEPTITAAQRNDFAVEEASAHEEHNTYLDAVKQKQLPDVYDLSRQKEIPGVVEEVKLGTTNEDQSNNQKLLEIGNFHNPPEALRSSLGNQQGIYQHIKPQSQENKETSIISNDYQQTRGLSFQGNSEPSPPVSYHTSVTTATSDSRVQFYREPPTFNRGAVAETVQRNVVAKKESISSPVPNAQRNTEGNPSGRRDARYQEKPHEEQAEKNYEIPEQVYGNPEQNYEVDEAVSVVTNGRAHGLQIPTPQPTRPSADSKEDKNKDSNHKFGYVVEGRNFRKYRVEERTPDGFIVGEYGVVSHDDGSLRGVRYTADSTINPRLIYDALVKFLSLK